MKSCVPLVLLAVVSVAQAAGPSFDCRKAASDAEKEICASPHLAELDRQIADVYSRGLRSLNGPERQKLIGNQVSWLKRRDAACCSTPQLAKYPNLHQVMEWRLIQLKTHLTSPGIDATGLPRASQEYRYRFYDTIDAELVPASVYKYLHYQAEQFIKDGAKFADRYSGLTAERFNEWKPMSFYYGPARLEGAIVGEKNHCYEVWELTVTLDAKWTYLREYFDGAGRKIPVPEIGTHANPILHGCEPSPEGPRLTFWTNFHPRAIEISTMELAEFVYSESQRKLLEKRRYKR